MRKTICLALAATMLSAVTFTRTYNKQEVLKANIDAQTWPWVGEVAVGVTVWLVCEGNCMGCGQWR